MSLKFFPPFKFLPEIFDQILNSYIVRCLFKKIPLKFPLEMPLSSLIKAARPTVLNGSRAPKPPSCCKKTVDSLLPLNMKHGKSIITQINKHICCIKQIIHTNKKNEWWTIIILWKKWQKSISEKFKAQNPYLIPD